MATATLPSANGAVSAADPFEMEVPPAGAGNFKLLEAGNYPANMIGLIRLGSHPETKDNGKEELVRKVALIFEFSGECDATGEPAVLGLKMTESAHEKSGLRLLIENWRGQKYQEGERFSPMKLVGMSCLANVVHKKTAKGKDTANIAAVSKLPKGMVAPTPFHDSIIFAMREGEPVPDFEWLPHLYGQKIPDLIRDSAEWKARNGGAARPGSQAVLEAAAEADDDDIPF